MRSPHVVLLASLAVLALLAATDASAQNADSIRAGARVRVWEAQPDAPSVALVGRVRDAGTQAITLDAPAGPITVPWTSVSHVDLSDGPRSGPRWRSGLIGGLAGAIGGGLLGVIIGDAAHRNAPKFGAAGIGVGGAAGAIIGAMNPGERWTPARVGAGDSRS